MRLILRSHSESHAMTQVSAVAATAGGNDRMRKATDSNTKYPKYVEECGVASKVDGQRRFVGVVGCVRAFVREREGGGKVGGGSLQLITNYTSCFDRLQSDGSGFLVVVCVNLSMGRRCGEYGKHV